MAELILNLSKKLNKNIEKNASFLNLTKERYLRQLLEHLAWVIESEIPFLDPSYIAAVIAERLPTPINDEQQWLLGEEDLDNNPETFLEKISTLFKKIKYKK